MPPDATARLAVLIDADNTSPSHAGALLLEVVKYGVPTVKRAYGDWTTTQLTSWKTELHQRAITPMQQFAYTKGKNSTDSALIIDAMDLLYSDQLEGFVLVSSDSDFTRLATRLREAGKTVYGIGRRTTPTPFVAACDRFIYLEVLGASKESPGEDPAGETAPRPDPKPMLIAAVEQTSDEDGWTTLSTMGNYLSKTHSDFDPRTYGHAKLSGLIKTQSYLELTSPDAESRVHRVRLAPRRTRKRVAKKA